MRTSFVTAHPVDSCTIHLSGLAERSGLAEPEVNLGLGEGLET